MKSEFPAESGLSNKLQQRLAHFIDGRPTVTDAQYEALEAGIAKGKSVLLVAPTSSGKTDAGYYALSSWLENDALANRKVVYLTSHRALARQKFQEILLKIPSIIGCDPDEIVVCTGDISIDGGGSVPNDPLEAILLIATYEKFLGLISSSGLRKDMSHYCFVCDELQIINDPSRGSSVEVLLTLLKQANYGQMVGLSAVISANDAKSLASWLKATLVRTSRRETPIEYELRSKDRTLVVNTSHPDQYIEQSGTEKIKTIEILEELTRDESNLPIAVFCMRRQDVFDLSKAWARSRNVPEGPPNDMPPEFVEITSTSEELACYVPFKFGYHSADLIDEERHYVEDSLDRNVLDVVFSTTTLAMGLNYAFKTVIFDRWQRYNFERRQQEAIPRSEFHNISGRAGRLGYASSGRVILSAANSREFRAASSYLDLGELEAFIPRLRPDNFENIALQLVSSGIVGSQKELMEFLQATLSASVELDVDKGQGEVWGERLDMALANLKSWGFLY